MTFHQLVAEYDRASALYHRACNMGYSIHTKEKHLNRKNRAFTAMIQAFSRLENRVSDIIK